MPWEQAGIEPPAAAAAPARQRPGAIVPRARPASAFAAVHWSVIALTMLTALSVLVGSYRADSSRSRELLPVMMTAP